MKILERSQQKILEQIKKRSCRYTNNNDDSNTSCCELPNITPGCSHKSKKVCRHPISSDPSSHLRQVDTGELKSNINSTLKNKIISKPVNSKDLKNLNEKQKKS